MVGVLDAAGAGAVDDGVASERAAAIGDGAPCGGRAHRARALEAVDGDGSMVLAVDDADHQAGETVEIEEAIVLGMNGTRDHDFDGFANGRDQRIRSEEAELVPDECDDLAGLVAVGGHGLAKRFTDVAEVEYDIFLQYFRSEEHRSEI